MSAERTAYIGTLAGQHNGIILDPLDMTAYLRDLATKVDKPGNPVAINQAFGDVRQDSPALVASDPGAAPVLYDQAYASALRTQINNLRTDQTRDRQLINQIIDVLQDSGLLT